MTKHRVSSPSRRLGAIVGALAMVGCNMITGADGIVFVDDDGKDSGSSVGASGSGDAESTSAGVGGGQTSSSGAGATAPEMGPADGVSLTAAVVYQSVSRPVMEGGSPVSSNIPIVADRPALWRLFYETDAGYGGMPVTARLTLGDAPPIDETVTLGSSSTEGDPASTINLSVPAELMAAGVGYRIELLQPAEQSSGSNSAASFPSAAGEKQNLGAQKAGVLKVKLVPVQYNADGSGRLPDTSAGQLKLYEDMFYAMYPIADIELTVRAPVGWSSQIQANSVGWSNLLNAIADLRDNDNAPFDTYYYGIFRPTSSLSSYCSGGCVMGLGFIGGPQDDWSHSAIGVGYAGEAAVETAIHELGHNHGREHAPCGGTTSSDSSFPYSGASIGVWGYDMIQGLLFPPGDFKDMMSYCNPAWISDYNFRHIFERIQLVTGSDFYVPPALLNLTYTRVMVDGQGNGTWMSPIQLERPPMGESLAVSIQTSTGSEQKIGQLIRYDHLDGGVLFVPPPSQPGQSITSLSTVIKGKVIEL